MPHCLGADYAPSLPVLAELMITVSGNIATNSCSLTF